ncbi:hypothetical protein HK100_012111 [Physocladia obscura]|uniref:AB hydrolase-1 domain-containing protein n=1 Tax=Physocladia obscura TaxID=109957 RepID=A0AAD5XGH6_9FUNG|nr:hypothetical protein HK100_012111 [Physocladia obscura]
MLSVVAVAVAALILTVTHPGQTIFRSPIEAAQTTQSPLQTTETPLNTKQTTALQLLLHANPPVIRTHISIPLHNAHPSFVTFAGPSTGKTVVLIHGFPETGLLSWSSQILFLGQNGYNVIVPDLRGFNGSYHADTPVSDYNYINAALDIKLLLEAFVPRVGHDSGALTTWVLVRDNPELFACVVQLAGVHDLAYMDLMLFSPWKFIKHSWYIICIRTFGSIFSLAERFLAANNFEMLVNVAFGTSIPGAYSVEDIEEYKDIWKKPFFLTSMKFQLAWYRYTAPFSHSLKLFNRGKSEIPSFIPVTLVWGAKDPYFPVEHLNSLILQRINHTKTIMYENNTHWLQREIPDEINRVLDEAFSKAFSFPSTMDN